MYSIKQWKMVSAVLAGLAFSLNGQGDDCQELHAHLERLSMRLQQRSFLGQFLPDMSIELKYRLGALEKLATGSNEFLTREGGSIMVMAYWRGGNDTVKSQQSLLEVRKSWQTLCLE